MQSNLAQNTAVSPLSKVWTYVAERPLRPDEEHRLQSELERFVTQWTAHNAALRAYAEIYAHQVIFLAVDESQAGASGCSIDKSVHFLEDQSAQLGIDLFDRMRFGWVDADGNVRFDSRQDLSAMKAAGIIGPDTRMLNTLAAPLQTSASVGRCLMAKVGNNACSEYCCAGKDNPKNSRSGSQAQLRLDLATGAAIFILLDALSGSRGKLY